MKLPKAQSLQIPADRPASAAVLCATHSLPPVARGHFFQTSTTGAFLQSRPADVAVPSGLSNLPQRSGSDQQRLEQASGGRWQAHAHARRPLLQAEEWDFVRHLFLELV